MRQALRNKQDSDFDEEILGEMECGKQTHTDPFEITLRSQDEKLGLIYSARVRLARSTIDVDGKTVNLSPGMAVTTEIKTGKRRVIEYFLSPLMQYRDESLKER